MTAGNGDARHTTTQSDLCRVALGNHALTAALRQRPADVDAALQEVGPVGQRLGLNELAPALGAGFDPGTGQLDARALAPRLAAYLKSIGLYDEFCGLLHDRRDGGIDDDSAAIASLRDAMHMDMDIWRRMFTKTINARCAVFVGNAFKGSGCLVSPNLVLTCAHVIDGADPVRAPISVVLANRIRVGAEPTPIAYSPPATADLSDDFSQDDGDYAEDGDYALLRLRVPARTGTAIVSLAAPDWKPVNRAPVMLLHYPGGVRSDGYDQGILSSFTAPTKRWGYASPGVPGSSGGACFNNRGELIGIHQGRTRPRRKSLDSRFVPLPVMRDAIAPRIAADVDQPYTWSLDRRIDGSLVVGRKDLFTAFAKLASPDGKFRLFRIKRADPTKGPAGLGYSINLVRELIGRLGGGHRLMLLSWPQVFYHDFDTITRLAQIACDADLAEAGSDAELPGARSGETGRPAVIKGRAERLMAAIDARAARRDEIAWLVIEHAANDLGEQMLALETIVNVAQQYPAIRTVVVGNEDVRLSQKEVRVADMAHSDCAGLPIVEHLGAFEPDAVADFIGALHEDLFDDPPLSAQMRQWSGNILRGIEAVANRFPSETLPQVTQRLRAMFAPMLVDGEVPPR